MAYLKAVVNPPTRSRSSASSTRRGAASATRRSTSVEFEARKRGVGFETTLRDAIVEDWLPARTRATAARVRRAARRDARACDGDLRDLVEMVVEKAGLIAALEAERTDEALGRAENIREFFTVVE